MKYKVFKSLDRPSSFMWFKGRFILIPLGGILLSLVLILVLQTMIPVLLASFLCILFPLVPSIIWGLRIQDRKREKEFFKTLPVRRKGVLRIAVPPACIKRLSDSDLINYLQTEKKKK